ncbi:alpha/beta hydrolase [Pseudomonas wadenswilerensis]|jgi:pimeloyl-ACP methyl ester carboxylesterase|uniref:Serine hydrolase-like protein 2 n=1 Tax=Pseudomonas wadenswilerensis TaxID=1785161 RepID=A0A380SYU3_9PSED|nr:MULTISPECIES: alpha/beta hydrolase [Pseudomonas]MCE5980783.1 alpha/beta hydrolase [Pseudomonas sp. LF19]UVM24291.1 alpha/beta hydrolase [Pseudomonas wadenswilerensis]SPO66620.1 putative hydrolase or acyltransferase of alpha/beta superfamily [Pseudomonas sp. JV241A]SUQ62885.1 Serine hydrolase-like protein 2 [Pseudomonas wadenswilerensis]
MSLGNRGRDQSLDVNGNHFALRIWGNESGHPVLAVHGWLDNAASFERIAPLLEECFVVAPDLAGHGRSEHRRGDSGYYLWEHADDMNALVESLGWKRFSVLGHSMGTGVASILAAMNKSIDCMVFIDGMGAPFTIAEEDTVEHLKKSQRLLRLALRTRLHGFSAPQTAQFASLEAAISERRNSIDGALCAEGARLLAMRDLLSVGDGYRWRHDPRLVLPEAMPLTERQACDFLRQITCPLHLLLGRQGLFAGTPFDKRKNALPWATQVHWHDGGHHFHLEEPTTALIEQINAALLQREAGPRQRLVNE